MFIFEELFPGRRRGGFGLSAEIKAELCSSGFMSPPENREVQIRVAKLVGLLEQVEARFDKYCDQLEHVIISFEEIAGSGSAKPYTGLALQAMTRHFGSLQDAIISQINSARRKHSQDLPRISSGLSRLGLFETNKLKHCPQVSSLQLKHAWRPIRGLPDTSISILRAWLFQHFLHPYPNDSEKLMLASETGLSKNQVSNWFINARVRLWKPMIEEMYREEFAYSLEESNRPRNGISMDREGVED
ncbi:PREDICTED: BEL1-like homeodomain protein 11 isoform X3 [Tarenaya hassleriana]|uniref:BEL1-like homeodomain protein 11 isoform X3 n=1 Tax=Tarenaya hassleriana TaxID=28532 RepID=UPI00053C95DF|nr:PREDICTED: BEL1-like homeodomain protein 11 isoform X3 [Tarenaya hassleriana]XP_010533267.1 PREDICTED: BEL1-like homeodomain protein 11 isoform X3 [Tarenaya hassleriana]